MANEQPDGGGRKKQRSGAFRGSSLAQAIQGNFDHLMGAIRNLVRAHNVLVDDVEALATSSTETVQAVGSHTHDGAGTEPIGHDDLDGVSADQHHDEAHNILDAAHADTNPADTPAVGQVLTWNGSAWDAQEADPEAAGKSPKRGSRPPGMFWDMQEGEPGFSVPGTQGPPGTDGNSFSILGSYPDYASLVADHPTGSVGDGYIIAGDLWVWDDGLADWVNVGPIEGPAGPAGDPGADGAAGYDGAPGFIMEADDPIVFQGVPGRDGATGATGATGAQGDPGNPGTSGSDGAPGDPGEPGYDGVPGFEGPQGDEGFFVPGRDGNDGASSQTGTATKDIWVAASDLDDDNDYGSPTYTQGGVSPGRYTYWAMADAARTGVVGMLAVPEDWDSGALTMTVYYAPGSALGGAETFRIIFNMRILSQSGDIDDLVSDTSTTVDHTPGVFAAGALDKSLSRSMATPSAAGQYIRLGLRRQGDHANDDATSTFRLLGLRVTYTATVEIGPTGPVGAQGTIGPQGSQGVPAVAIPAFIPEDMDFPFIIPGTKGDTGETGPQGEPGEAPEVSAAASSPGAMVDPDDLLDVFPPAVIGPNKGRGSFLWSSRERSSVQVGRRIYPDFNGQLQSAVVYANVAPLSTVSVDVFKNGVSLWPTGTKPSLPAGSNRGTVRIPETGNFVIGDYFQVVILSSPTGGVADRTNVSLGFTYDLQ